MFAYLVYLRSLLAIPDVVHTDLVARWLEVPDSVRAMLQQRPTANGDRLGGSAQTAHTSEQSRLNAFTGDV